MQCDEKLGIEVNKHLEALGLETPLVKMDLYSRNINGLNGGQTYEVIDEAFQKIMTSIGLDLRDDSLAGTPKRLAKMYGRELFFGLDYANFPKATTVENRMKYDEMVCVRGIEVKSMCEHHLLPFIGTATIAYIPNERVLGLSKFNRITEFFSRRPQIQERLTEQIAAALQYILGTEDVAVVIKAKHYCVVMRGSEDHGSDTVTSKNSGRFRESVALRNEFLQLSQN